MGYCGAPGHNGLLSKYVLSSHRVFEFESPDLERDRYYAVPADMAPHIPSSIPWDIAGSIQPVAVGL